MRWGTVRGPGFWLLTQFSGTFFHHPVRIFPRVDPVSAENDEMRMSGLFCLRWRRLDFGSLQPELERQLSHELNEWWIRASARRTADPKTTILLQVEQDGLWDPFKACSMYTSTRVNSFLLQSKKFDASLNAFCFIWCWWLVVGNEIIALT